MTAQNNKNIASTIKVKPVQPRYINLNENIFTALDVYETRVYLALRYQGDYRTQSSDVELTIDQLIKLSKVKRTTLFECLNRLENKHFLIRRINWDKKTWGKANEYEIAQHLHYFKPIVEDENEEKNIKDNNNNDNTNGSYIEGVRPADDVVHQADDIVRPADDIVQPVHTVKKDEYKETYYQQSEKKKAVLNINDLENNNPHNLPKQMLEDWIINRKAKKAPITFTVWNKLNKDLAQCKNALDAFEQYVSSGYVGFNRDWFERPQSKNAPLNHDTMGWAKDLDKDMF